jgi:RecA/RadA recombinase
MCSDLTVPALQIIELYGYRFKVEVMFKSLKNTIGSFFYHFWTMVLPKFSRKTTETDLCRVTVPKDKEKIVSTVKAILPEYCF